MEDDNDPILEIDVEDVTFRTLFEAVSAHGEIIITIDRSDLAAVKRGLTVYKSRLKAKIKDAGLPPDENVLRYVEIPLPDNKLRMKLHIIYGMPRAVTVHHIELPDDTL